MAEITVKKGRYRIMQIALIVVSRILLCVMIDWIVNLKYYALFNNFGFYEDGKYKNHSCVMLGDSNANNNYIMLTICCKDYTDNCFLRFFSCSDTRNLNSCDVRELDITSGKKILKQLKGN
jgi:hypothetical protein